MALAVAQSASLWQPQLGVPVHAPATQVSPVVQLLPSLHAKPDATVWVQPRARSQPSLLHGLLSSHALATAVWLQPPAGSQLSVVQSIKSSQLAALPAHFPARQLSPAVQALPSSQTDWGSVMASCTTLTPWSQ